MFGSRSHCGTRDITYLNGHVSLWKELPHCICNHPARFAGHKYCGSGDSLKVHFINNLKSINNLKKSETWKIPLTIAINFVSFKGTNEKRKMLSKSDIKLSWKYQ